MIGPEPGCLDCAKTTGGCLVHSQGVFTVGPDGQMRRAAPEEPAPPMPILPDVKFFLMGWKCPGCGACYSPYVSSCLNCGPRPLPLLG